MMVRIRRKRKVNRFVRFIFAIVAAYMIFALLQLQVDIMNRRTELSELKEKCEAQRLANKEAERMLTLGDTDLYVERVAREKLDFAYPDEKIYIDISGN